MEYLSNFIEAEIKGKKKKEGKKTSKRKRYYDRQSTVLSRG